MNAFIGYVSRVLCSRGMNSFCCTTQRQAFKLECVFWCNAGYVSLANLGKCLNRSWWIMQVFPFFATSSKAEVDCKMNSFNQGYEDYFILSLLRLGKIWKIH